jgi:hypothetical protein
MTQVEPSRNVEKSLLPSFSFATTLYSFHKFLVQRSIRSAQFLRWQWPMPEYIARAWLVKPSHQLAVIGPSACYFELHKLPNNACHHARSIFECLYVFPAVPRALSVTWSRLSLIVARIISRCPCSSYAR